MVTVTASTIMVRLVASCLLGHTTFFSSERVSRQNCATGFSLLPFIYKHPMMRGGGNLFALPSPHLSLGRSIVHLVSRCRVWMRHRGQYFLISRRPGSFLLLLLVV